MVNECFILNNTSLAAIMAKKWPRDYENLKNSLPAWNLFYNIAGYETLPEERVSSYLSDITDITKRLGVEAVKAAGEVSAVDLLKMVKQPSVEPYWKLRYKGACEDVFFLTINDKLGSQIEAMYGLAEKAGYSTSDMGVYVQPIVQGTGVHCEFNLFYDPANSSEAERVKNLSASAVKGLMAKGAFFSRPYGENARAVMNRDAATVAVFNKLKKMFDPNRVMNPGKVCF
jgi:FAD/FMN-containing dehydrogenase